MHQEFDIAVTYIVEFPLDVISASSSFSFELIRVARSATPSQFVTLETAFRARRHYTIILNVPNFYVYI